MKDCTYCEGIKPVLVKGDVIYPHRKDLYQLNFYQCPECEAYCGTHKGTTKPLGTTANGTLRQLRSKCHRKFDPLWRDTNHTRKSMYSQLANIMQIHVRNCHIAMFDEQQCRQCLIACDTIVEGWD